MQNDARNSTSPPITPESLLESSRVLVRGVAASGLGKAARFTTLPWVVEQFASKLGIRPWPGTFNIRVSDAASLEAWASVVASGGIEIEPPNASACVARCYPASINDRISGAAIVPHVPAYPRDQIEVIAALHLRSALALNDGDPVFLRLDPTPQGDVARVPP